jgi:glutamate-1-semialdehyde 2,1-aminomutase
MLLKMNDKTEKTKMQLYHEQVKKLLPGGVHYNFNLPWEETPIHFVNTKGSRVFDMDGNEYLDLYARFGATIVGHNNEEYKAALIDVINRVLSVSHCDLDLEVLELIHKYVPSAEMIRFGVSGTEIVQNAIRLARAYTGKNKFVRFENHYHGNMDNIMGGKAKDPKYPVPSDYPGDSKGTAGRAKGVLETESFLIPWNDVDAIEELVHNYGDEIAAIITEPVCVNGGSVEPAEGYLEKLRELCDKNNIVLIFDEIITGFRMGLGGAQGKYGVKPDLTTFGKAIAGGGVPVSVLAGKREIMKLYEEKKVIHAGTFNGYPLGMAAIKATLGILGRDNGAIYDSMNAKMLKMRKILVDSAAEIGIDLIVQGPAGCGAFHCCKEPFTSPSQYTFDIMSKDIILNTCMQNNGILVSSVSRLYPNITLNDDDVAYFAKNVKRALMDAKAIFEEIY